jgi:hypothetical protein
VWDILHRRGLTLPPAPRHDKVWHEGEAFTVGKNGYLRSTRAGTREKGCSRLLHRVVWEEHHGPVPEGLVLWFKDQDRENCAISNLECITRREVRRRMKNKNAWTVFYEIHDHLLGEWQAATAAGKPAAEIEAARQAYESLQRPNVWTAKRRRQHIALMKKLWAAYTPEQRRERALKAARIRRERRQAEQGTAVERMVA